MGAPPDLKLRPRSRGVALPSPPGPSSKSLSSPSSQSPSSPSSASPASPSLPPLPAPLRKAPSPLSSPLPSLRVLLHPTPGLGVDMRLPLSRRTRCYMQLDSFFNGPSVIRIGLHPRNHPGVRLQLSPIPRLSLRVPFHIGGAKFLQIGMWCGFGVGNTDVGGEMWKKGVGVRGGVTMEIWRYTTGIGMMDERVRTKVREVLKGSQRKSRMEEIPVDPREREKVLEVMKEVLRERRKVREGRTGIPNGGVVGKDGKS